MEGDDYFDRQDLDVEFRKNSLAENVSNIELINKHAHKTKLILCTSAAATVVERSVEATSDTYWCSPLVDDPKTPDSLTKKLHSINKLPYINTGGTVGIAAWVFASSDTASIIDVLFHSIEFMKSEFKKEYDYVLLLELTFSLREKDNLSNLILKLDSLKIATMRLFPSGKFIITLEYYLKPKETISLNTLKIFL